MHKLAQRFLLLFGIAIVMAMAAPSSWAQLPFYTDDTGVTAPGQMHFEFFDELDRLQLSQFPDLRQNTVNLKINYGLPHHLEMDLDAPLLAIYRAPRFKGSAGLGDTDMGLKWRFHNSSSRSHIPSLATSFYVELPTGNAGQQLSSELRDYWLNFIAQEPLTEKTRINFNAGFLFAGNTSTGVVGIQTRRGHVYTSGISLLHDFTRRLTLGVESVGGIADESGLGRSQLQFLGGGEYGLRNGLSLTFAALGGRYAGSPRAGGQLGFAVDFPAVFKQ